MLKVNNKNPIKVGFIAKFRVGLSFVRLDKLKAWFSAVVDFISVKWDWFLDLVTSIRWFKSPPN